MDRLRDLLDDLLDRFDDRRYAVADRWALWPIAYRVLAGMVVLAIVGVVAYALVGRGDGRPPKAAAGATTTSGPARPVAASGTTTSSSPTTTESSTTTVPARETTVPTTTVAPPTTVEPPPTTPAPAVPVTTAPPPPPRRPPATVGPRLGTFCGFVPGSSIEIDINRQDVGTQTADAGGCVTVIR